MEATNLRIDKCEEEDSLFTFTLLQNHSKGFLRWTRVCMLGPHKVPNKAEGKNSGVDQTNQ